MKSKTYLVQLNRTLADYKEVLVTAPAMMSLEEVQRQLLNPDGVFDEEDEDIWDDDGTWRGNDGWEPELSVEVVKESRASDHSDLPRVELLSWNDNSIQFPRLIAELEAAGAFTPEVMEALRDSMDLETNELSEIVNRAQEKWEEIVSKT